MHASSKKTDRTRLICCAIWFVCSACRQAPSVSMRQGPVNDAAHLLWTDFRIGAPLPVGYYNLRVTEAFTISLNPD